LVIQYRLVPLNKVVAASCGHCCQIRHRDVVAHDDDERQFDELVVANVVQQCVRRPSRQVVKMVKAENNINHKLQLLSIHCYLQVIHPCLRQNKSIHQ
jgi:uncharacterized metal-binding protein YceD (DUF177 family)